MNILVLGLDSSILDKNSMLAKRAIEYGDLVNKYEVIVPSLKNEKFILSERVKVNGVKSKNKIYGLFKIYYLANILIKKEKFSVISAQDQYYLGLISLILSRKFKIGFEIQIHGFEKYSGLRKLVAKYVLPRANSVRCVSQRLKKLLVNEFKVDENKITVVPIHLELRITNYESRIKKEKDKFIFLTVGRLVPVKNIKMQIRAFNNLEAGNRKLELWIVGDGPERKNIELSENVKLLGWQDDLEKFYNQADVFLLTSDSEGWGLTVIEAANYGLPIIMTDVGCAGEVIRDNESGIVIPVGDQKKLEEAMARLMNDKDLRNKLSRNAQGAVKKLPSKEETLVLYKKSWEIALI